MVTTVLKPSTNHTVFKGVKFVSYSADIMAERLKYFTADPKTLTEVLI